ncbi:MAG: hypothetical protein JXA23_11055 [Bacteroidales bacterium]|nr:hypothetical protein [Bacteroidales bacterium]
MATKSLYDQGLPHDEIMYREHFQRGNDFCKIELFRSAREEFKAALHYKPGDEASKKMEEDCENQIQQDARKVYIIIPIVLVIIAAVILFV